MEFGRVDKEEIGRIDFSLPEEPSTNKKILRGKAMKYPRVWMGCAKWGRHEWLGKIYPSGTKEKDYLQHYAEHYNSIELNATHYKIYGPRAIEKWAKETLGKDFRFCPKMHKGVTHRGKLNSKPFLQNEFLRGVRSFADQLGPVFIQVNERFGLKRKEELFNYLADLPKDIQFFIELRHRDWFEKASTEFFEFLTQEQIGAVITDTAGRRDCVHMHLTILKTFIRFVGNSLHPTDYKRCDEWVKRIKHWLDKGLKELYFFMHMHDEATSPELTVYLAEQLNKHCGLELPVPSFYEKNIPISKKKKAS